MDFVVVDFETANEDLASVCQVGIVRFMDGIEAGTYTTLIDPQDDFSSINSSIHGIRESHVRGFPIFSAIYPKIVDFISNSVVISHTAFDRSTWSKVTERHSLPSQPYTWLDSSRVARRTWEQYARSGYGLANIAKDLGIQFKHHDALEDARTAGLIFLQACQKTGMNLEEWLLRVNKPISSSASASIAREGNENGLLHGEVVVFTGTLSLSRQRAADMAAAAGCDVGTGVTKKTTLLVVGDQDIRKFGPGQEKSSKHLKAEELISAGHPIRIVQETDFLRIVNFQ